eukprot:6043519-Pyramimonas_sp.AAC.1
MRAALVTFPEWRMLFSRLDANKVNLTLFDTAHGLWNPGFWDGAPLVVHLSVAAAGFESNKLLAKAGRA